MKWIQEKSYELIRFNVIWDGIKYKSLENNSEHQNDSKSL